MRITLAATATLFLLVAAAQAQPVADHLKCYKVKDSQAKASYTADLGGLIAEPNCIIKVPGNLFCTESTKTNVTPTPPGGIDNTGPAGRFLCYKIKCPKATVAPFQWHDQFGDRQLTPGTPKIVCAPEIVTTTTTTAASTTSTTAASTTSTTAASTTTTTTLQGLGTACTAGTECTSGFCVDGVCCNTACTGVCTACSAAMKGQGADGTCGNVAAGLNPNSDCTMMPASTCGTTGVCDGTGACQLYAAGTTCAAPSCNGETHTNASTCDGLGNCNAGTMTSCSPYVCTVGGCKTSCASDADCIATDFCSGGVCAPRRSAGSSCTANDNCISNICTGGLCQ